MINTVIKKYQDEMINVVNQAGVELPATVIQLILQNIMYQVNIQVNMALESEAMETSNKK